MKIPAAEELLSPEGFLELWSKTSTPYKRRFLIKAGNKLQYRPVADVAYFFAEGKQAYLVTKSENRKYLIDQTLEELERVLDPAVFFRINRKFIVCVDSIVEVRSLGSRLQVKLNQPCDYDLSVSRDRAQVFKSWLDL